MLRAIIFDFNGVIVNDEPTHLKMLQRVLNEEGLSISQTDYYSRYLGMDDRGCFRAAYRDYGRELDESTLSGLIERKARYYRDSIQEGMVIFPGVKELVLDLSGRFRLAIASGALRSEIEMILQGTSLRKYFRVVVSAEDINEGKPSPEIFIKALSLLNQEALQDNPIAPSECLVVEDSKEGILGAHRAGIKCLAVANSHPAEKLGEADAVVASLAEVTVPFLEKLFA